VTPTANVQAHLKAEKKSNPASEVFGCKSFAPAGVYWYDFSRRGCKEIWRNHL
jgi:hypothetical protein